MRTISIFLWFVLTAAKGFALDCGRAVTPVEQAICKQPDLAHLDAELNDVYERLRPKLTVKARSVGTAQQRAWMAERNRICGDGDASCLRKAYETRLGQLNALDVAASAATDIPSSNLHPLVLRGEWKATTIYDPGAKNVEGKTDLPYSLSLAELPAVGDLVRSEPGKLCIQGQKCGGITWTRTTLAKVDGAEAMHRVLGIAESNVVLIGNQGAQMAPLITLVQRDHGILWAIFSLGRRRGDSDHYAAEEWTPVGPAATLGPLP